MSTKPSKVEERVADLNLVEDLYHRLGPVLDALALNHEGIAYHLLANGSTQKFIASRYHTTEANLHNWLKKHGLKLSKARPMA